MPERRLLAIVLLAAPLYFWRLDRPGFSDTEGMFAEPAREMLTSGDWVTPHLNGEPFLTKPPLMYWLPAAVFRLAGPTEYARLCPAVAALGTVAVTGALGAELYGADAGIAAATVLATSIGFLVEARLLRADMVMMLAITLALWCHVRVRHRGGTAAAMGFWIAIGVGILDKGFLAAVLPAGAIVLAERPPRAAFATARALHVVPGVAVLAAIALPWHLLAGARTPGFLWDYVVNQHLLVFFDAKLPRDSIPDSLPFFWAMFAVRGLPWSLLLPAALLHAWRTGAESPLHRLPAAWIAVVLGFFSLASSRLEHYSLPALPAVALMVGRLLADAAAGRVRVAPAWFIGPPAAVAVLGLVCALAEPARTLAILDRNMLGYGLEQLARPTMIVLASGLGIFVLLLGSRRVRAAVLVGASCAAALFVCAQVAHERLEPLFSWRPFARTIAEQASASTPLFFRASDEYQLCGGLDFYTRRHVALLSPRGWVPPTFLAHRVHSLFIPPAQLERAWHERDALLVSDDVARPGDEASLVPGPYVVLARAGTRVLLRAVSPADGSPQTRR